MLSKSRFMVPVLLGVTFPFTLSAEDAPIGEIPKAAPNQEVPKAFRGHKIPLVVDASGGFLLCKVQVDSRDIFLLVDSGAQMEFGLSKAWATENNMELTERGGAEGIGGKTALFSTKLGQVRIGKALDVNDINAIVSDLPIPIPFPKQEDGVVPSVQGLMGSQFLMKAQAVVNYADKHLYIPALGATAQDYLKVSLAAGDRGIPLIKSPSGTPYITIKMGEKEFSFLVDNAAGSNVLLTEAAKEWGVELSDAGPNVAGVGGAAGKAKYGLADNVLIGGSVKLPKLDFAVMPSPGGLDLPKDAPPYGGILGNRFFSQLKARLDFGSYHMILPKLGGAVATGGKDGRVEVRANNVEEAIEGVVKQHYHSIPLTRSESGLYFVETKVNRKPRWFCLDSSTVGMVLDTRVATEDAVAVTEGKGAVGANGEKIPSTQGKLETFAVGPNTFQSPMAAFVDLSEIAPLKLGDGTSHKIDGLLGIAYLKSLPVAVDVRNARILVSKAKIKGGFAGIKSQTGSLLAPMVEDAAGKHYLVTEIMGKKGLLLVDFGRVSTVLFESAAQSLKLETKSSEATKTVSITDFKLGDHQIKDAMEAALVAGGKAEEVAGMPVFGMAGCSLFEALESVVDFNEVQITLNPKVVKKP